MQIREKIVKTAKIIRSLQYDAVTEDSIWNAEAERWVDRGRAKMHVVIDGTPMSKLRVGFNPKTSITNRAETPLYDEYGWLVYNGHATGRVTTEDGTIGTTKHPSKRASICANLPKSYGITRRMTGQDFIPGYAQIFGISLIKLLERPKGPQLTISVQPEALSGVQYLAIRIRLTLPNVTQTEAIWLDESKGFALVRRERNLEPIGAVGRHCRDVYETHTLELIDAGVWFPTSSVYSTYRGGIPKIRETFTANGIQLNPPLSEEIFSLRLEAGYRVHDERTNAEFTTKEFSNDLLR